MAGLQKEWLNDDDEHFLSKLLETVKFKISDVRNLWYSLKLGIENLFKWTPVIWRDRDWDHHFLFEILAFKISNMERSFRKYGHHVEAEKDANNMSMCVETLHRLMEEDYQKKAFKKHDEKWGEPSLKFIDSDKKDFKQLLIERPNVKTKEDEEQERKEFRYCLKEEERLTKQDIDYIFDMLKKHIREWWD